MCHVDYQPLDQRATGSDELMDELIFFYRIQYWEIHTIFRNFVVKFFAAFVKAAPTFSDLYFQSYLL